MLIPFGGAGPTHAVMLAEEAALAGVTVPTAAAIFCALGAAVADLRRDFVRSLGKVRLASLTDRLWANWQELEAHAQRWLDGEGVPITGRRLVHAIDMQYAGQSFSLTVAIPAMVRAACDLNGVMRAFHQAHQAIYGFREPDHAIEAITQRLSIIGEVPKADLPDLAPGADRALVARRATGVPRGRLDRRPYLSPRGSWRRRRDRRAGGDRAGRYHRLDAARLVKLTADRLGFSGADAE